MVYTAPLHINTHLNTTPGQHKTEHLFLNSVQMGILTIKERFKKKKKKAKLKLVQTKCVIKFLSQKDRRLLGL